MNIFKIEDIKDKDIERILEIMLNWGDYTRTDDYLTPDETKVYYNNVIDIWIKRYPKVAKIVDYIEAKNSAYKYNL